MTEQDLATEVSRISDNIKIVLLRKHMSQVELAELINTNSFPVTPPTLNRAIKGDMSPKSVEIRSKIYKVLDI
ncbi:transcriptional regulator [Furfurilactobacillus entadae]|uniref:transcriptional regulator n=1 Tax=Furfurilactobacillus entadae TaxID=2922307 RepID=UPI0035E66F0E